MQMQAALRAAAPRGGGRGWQAGGDVAAPTPPGGYTPAGPAPSMAEWFASRGMSDALQDFMPQDPGQFQWAAQQEAMRKAAAAAARAQAATARRGTQAQRLGSRGPGGWYTGGPVKGFARGDLAIAENRLDTTLGQGLPQSVFSNAYNRAAQVRSRDDPDFKASILGRLGTLPLDILTQLAEIMLSPAQSASGLSAGRQARETGEYLSQEDVNAIFNPNSREALIAERDRLQQQLQTADEAMAQEIMAQIMEINKELEMAAAPGMAGGGILSLRGGGRTVNPRAWARRPIQQALQVPMGPPARLSRPGWGSPGLDIPGGG